MSETVYA